MTDRAAEAYDSFITMVWSLPSYLTSAADYHTYLGNCVADPTPAFWLARGPAEECVIKPLQDALSGAGVNVVKGVRAVRVSCRQGRAERLVLRPTRFDQRKCEFVDQGKERTEEVEELVLAVTAPELSRLVRTGKPGERIVDFVPRASELSRLETLPIPILYVFFNYRLPDVPSEPVGLSGSRLALAFTDISQTWKGLGKGTVLALSCSDPHGLPGTGWQDDALTMLRELANYLDFNPPTGWGASGPIDWGRTRYDANADAQLFVNEIGTDTWRPYVVVRELPNVCFAGDFSRNRVGMTTIESAATAGVQAAAAIVDRHGIGEPVQVREPKSLPEGLYGWLRLAWMPYVTGAKLWSSGDDCARALGDRLRELLS
jgi:hypothetical protein